MTPLPDVPESRLITPNGKAIKATSTLMKLVLGWQVFRNIAFIPVILAISTYLFLGVGQLHDVVIGLKEEFNQEYQVRLSEVMLFHGFVFAYPVSLLLWSAITYSCARIVLVSPIDVKKDDFSIMLIKYTPWILSALPFFTMAIVFSSIPKYFLLTLLSFGIVFSTFWYFRAKVDSLFPHIDWQARLDTTIKEDWLVLMNSTAATFFIKFNFIFFFVILVLFLLPQRWGIAIWMGPIPIVMLGMAFLMLIASILVYFNDNRYRPILLITLIGLVLMSQFTDNSALQTVNSPLTDANRPDIETHFLAWARHRSPKLDQEIPIILVAAEGGGIRALNWTARALWGLNVPIPNFNKYLYAISGVSGGSVGATFYTSFLRDKQRYKELDQQVLSGLTFRWICRDDYVSGLTSAYLFPEMAQNFIPYPIPYFDRTKWLENSWSNGYRRMTKRAMEMKPNRAYKPAYEDGLTTLDESFIGFWNLPDKKRYNYELPSLFLNCTLSETGQKAVISNLRLDPQSFKDVVDVIKYTNQDLPLKTAASASARFPLVTSGGLIENRIIDKVLQSGHLTDGGYFDNTGIESAVQLMNTLLNIARKHKFRIRPVIIFMQNGNENAYERQQAIFAARSIRVPWGSFYNSWNRGTFTRTNMYDMLLKRTMVDSTRSGNVAYVPIGLKWDFEGEYPLGWYLSRATIGQMNKRLNGLFVNQNLMKSHPELDTLRNQIRRIEVANLAVSKAVPISQTFKVDGPYYDEYIRP